jgi:predicted ATPase
MTEPDKLAAMRILSSTSSSAFLAAPELFALMVLQGVTLSVKHGNAPLSATSYAAYGLILCSLLGDITAGYRFGRLALTLLGQLPANHNQVRTLLVVNHFLRGSKEHIRASLPALLEVYHHGLDTGDTEFAAWGMYAHGCNSHIDEVLYLHLRNAITLRGNGTVCL